MPVLKSKDGKDLLADCHCGGNEGMRIRIEKDDTDTYAFLSYVNGNWYRDQNMKILRILEYKIKKIWYIIRSKDHYYAEIVMTKDEFETFKEYINGIC